MTDAAEAKSAKPRPKLSAAVSRSLREGTLWVLGALALILLLALLVLSPARSRLHDTGEPGPVSNWIGPVGAWLPDSSFSCSAGPPICFR